MINDPSYDPLRQQIHNQGYLLIQMKISQMEKIRINDIECEIYLLTFSSDK